MSKKADEPADAPDDFVNLFKRGLKFTEELMDENQDLRIRLASVEATQEATQRLSGTPAGEATLVALKAQVEELEKERIKILDSYHEVEDQSRSYQSRYTEIEEEYNRLANLYIASYQMHSTTAFHETVQVICEIVINLVGVSRFRLFLRDSKANMLHSIATEGHQLEDIESIAVGDGAIGKAVADGVSHDGENEQEPLCVVVLKAGNHCVGAIVIDELLVQKENFSDIDHELFQMLGAQAAATLISGLLRAKFGSEALDETFSIDHARALLNAD
ncbi:MAG: diguanylate phosphodiesterase [Deltaproteobacteria bacterium]|nr:diguanylate phosphodiesterase [Deltaproteobacteria bacterium]